MDAALSRLQIRSEVVRAMLAEFLGTFVLMVFGTASVAQMKLDPSNSGSVLSINFSWGFAVMLGVFVSGGISGGHLNPAVSVALATTGSFPWIRVAPYLIAQYLGSFMGSATTYWIYLDAISKFDRDNPNAAFTSTAGIFTTFPQDYLTLQGGFADQVVGTALLLLGVMAITDPRNMESPKHFVAFGVGCLVMTIGMTFGLNCGYAINPARDLSPRILTYIAGWGSQVFTYGENFWWIPIVGPHLGAIVGVWIYKLLVSVHWPPPPEEDKVTKVETQF